jgi:hypothetical protein
MYWRCCCDCGHRRNVAAVSLRNGTSQSCGCFRLEKLRLPAKDAAVNKKLNSVKQSARIRKIIYELTDADAKSLISSPCFYCGDLELFANGIDRKNPEIGYTKRNSVPCCGDCNFMKLSLSVKQFLEKCLRVVQHQKIGAYSQ